MATLDSGLIVRTSDLAKRKAQNVIVGEAAMNVDAFIARIVSRLGGGHLFRGPHHIERDRFTEMDWTKLGGFAKGISGRPPTVGFILGPLSVEKKARKISRRQARENPNADIIRPQEVCPLTPLQFYFDIDIWLVERGRYQAAGKRDYQNGSNGIEYPTTIFSYKCIRIRHQST
jgi:hypothetical protein